MRDHLPPMKLAEEPTIHGRGVGLPARPSAVELVGLVTFAAVGSLGLAWLSGWQPLALIASPLAMAGAATVLYTLPRWPVASVGIVFLLACFSRLLIDLPLGTMRLEQPAIAALILAVIYHRHRLRIPDIRPLIPLIGAALLYLAVLTLSSVIVAEQPLASLRMVFWSALSMTAGLIAAVLVAGRIRNALPWLSGSGAVMALIGMAIAIAYFLFHGAPTIDLIVGRQPKVTALVHEANLYASLLGAVTPLAVEQYRQRPGRLNLALLVLLLLAIGVGVTRGAYIGLAAGLLVYFGLFIVRAGRSRMLARAGAIVLAAGVVGLVLPAILLNPASAGVLMASPDPTTSPRPTAPPGPRNELQTLEYRMQRVFVALDEFRDSPLIGHGAFAFGQHHLNPIGRPDTVAVLPIAVLHDAGLIGLAALSAFLAMLGLRLWRASADESRIGPVAALAGAVVVLLVAYLATTALHFAVTWLIFGCAAGATLAGRPSGGGMGVAARSGAPIGG